MAKILVTGSKGQLGAEVNDLQSYFPQHRFLLADKEDLDITSAEKVQALFSSFQPHYCINGAAYTAVDKAESEREAAFASNAGGVKNLATACAVSNTFFIHISTDYVFDGTATTPYTENTATNPVNLYGQSKLQSETEAINATKDALVIRTSWVYSAYGNNFVKTMLRLMQAKPEINVVADQQGSPTYAADLAEAIMQIIDKEKWHPGIYHYTNEGIITWFDFAKAIKEITGSPCLVHPIATKEYPTPAKRPAYSGLSKDKIRSVYNLPIKPWKESLERCLHKLSL